MRLQGDFGTHDVALEIAVDIRRHRVQAREANQRQHFAQTMQLHHRCDSLAVLRTGSPRRKRQPTGVEVGIGWRFVAKALFRPKQGFEFRFLQWPQVPGAAAYFLDSAQHLAILERLERLRDLRHGLERGQHGGVLHHLQHVPYGNYRFLHGRACVR